MRIAFFTHYTALYGANRSLLDLIDGLRLHSIETCVVAPGNGELTGQLERRSVPLAVIPFQWWMSSRNSRRESLRRLLQNIRFVPTLARQLRRWNIDAVYTNSSVIPIGALVARLGRWPHIWHLREFGDLDYGLHHDWGQRVFRSVVQCADAKIAISHAVRAHLLGGTPADGVHIIYNGVAWGEKFDDLYKQAHAKPPRSRPYTFALVGLIHPQKGQASAIRATSLIVNRFPGVRLLIVGSGGDKYVRGCQELAKQLGVGDKVEFWDYAEDPYKAFMVADACLMCSEYEAMGRVTAEAMSACRPVIGYDQGGTTEILEHERTGLLYRGGPEALAECMLRFVEDPAWAQHLGENGWQEARKKFTTEVYSQQVYDVLQKVVAKRRLRN